MPLEEATIDSITEACLVDLDGIYGSQDGDYIAIYFFFQVEAFPGITEAQMNAAILKDIEITIVDFLIPRLFVDDCGPTTEERKLQPSAGTTEGYVGLSSKPADFVLRGCKFFFRLSFVEKGVSVCGGGFKLICSALYS
jgi:hypothetical protein